jgi:hypothetical protein
MQGKPVLKKSRVCGQIMDCALKSWQKPFHPGAVLGVGVNFLRADDKGRRINLD